MFTVLFFCSVPFFLKYSLYLWTYSTSCTCIQYSILHSPFYAVHHWFVCSTLLVCLQYIIDLSAVHHWFVCSALLICLQYTIDFSAVHHWFVCSTPFICLQYSLYLFTVLPLFVYNTKKLQNNIVGSYVTLIIFIKQLVSLF